MAPAMSVTDPVMQPMWHGQGVTVADVMDALKEIRYKFARAESGDDEHLCPRNCVMTLIGIAATEAHEALANRTTQVIGTQHPAQAIVIREEAPVRKRHLDAWITTHVRRPETTCAVECEHIALYVHGRAADHLGAILDPLLVSGVPTYLWWLGTPPFGRAELTDALRTSDGLVVDSSHFEEPYHAFRKMSSMLKVVHHRLGLGDLQWARLRPWRENIAQFFSPADRRAFLGGISELGVDYAGEGRGNRIAALLMTGWISSALGWKLRRATGGAGGIVVANYESGGRSIEVEFRSLARHDRVPGEVTSVRLAGTAHGTTFRLSVAHDPPRSRLKSNEPEDVERRRSDTGRVLLTMIEIGDAEALRHVQQLEPEDPAALLVELLATGAHDDVYNRSLSAAAELMERL